jgi:nicotinamidase-related amidase
MTPFVLLVDLQQDYLRAEGLEPAADEIVSRAAALLEGCRATGIPVAHVWTTVSRADDQRMPHWKRLGKWMCVDGTPGHAPPAPLRPENSEPVIHKTFFCSFSSGTLAPLLAAHGVDTLVMAGVHLHACVRQTVISAYERGFDIWVADDAVGSDDPLHAAITRRYLQTRAAQFASVAELLAMLSSVPAPTITPAPSTKMV